MTTPLPFGKHKNKTIEEAFEIDPLYCQWLFKQPMAKTYPDIYDFLQKQFINKNDYYLSFGRYKNRPLSYVIQTDPQYLNYLKNNEYVQKNITELAQIINHLNIP